MNTYADANADLITVLIADDHPLILAGLAALVDATPGLTLVGQADNGARAVELYRQHRPQVTIMDLSMPVMHGLEAIGQILAVDEAARIVILTTYQGDEDVRRGMRAGARGYLLKDSGPEQLVACIHAVAQGRQFLPPEVASKLAERTDVARLSPRELEILAHLATGKSNKMIARSAAIEVGTVKFHVNNILAKLNVGSRTEAATVASRRGLLSAF
ncbi:two-component system NarL family response regulator [Duganella sp. 3397]|uniref:response regulator transcription factor n=1 Tax=Duganella sp. 3397 TaxID=2817732 RepID=UPI0028641FDC|nr:response regulator transcription factor [Duganella sp. 3397]MDR7049424.1 two-component system NarL family response regulator [Duganella sp. 3397]